MRILFSSFLFTVFFFIRLISIEAGDVSRSQYLQLNENFPKLISSSGDHFKGEIEIVTNAEEMATIEQMTGRDVGILMKDRFWIWVNDACVFPNGNKGVYGRILWVKALEGVSGVAVMPMTVEGKIVLNCSYRHATRSWEIELPRGCVNPCEELEMAAKRETAEETGMLVDELTYLGEITPDSGLTGTVVPIFLATVIGKQNSEPEDSEAIEEILHLTISEIEQAFVKGYYEHKIRGEQKRVPFRDPFLAYAILMYRLKQNNTAIDVHSQHHKNQYLP